MPMFNEGEYSYLKHKTIFRFYGRGSAASESLLITRRQNISLQSSR